MDRDRAFSIPIIDPDNPDNSTPCKRMITVGKDLLVIKSDGIYQMITAETLDPSKENPETKHTYKKLYSIGSENSFVARGIIQFGDMIKFLNMAGSSIVDVEKLKLHIWEINQLILKAEESYFSIYDQSQSLLKSCDEIIENAKKSNSSYVPPLPQVQNLEQGFNDFLSNIKKAIVKSYKMLELFYEIKASKEENFEEWISKLEKKIPNSKVLELLKTDLDWCKFVSGLRNAQQHDREGNRIEIKNFTMKPGNKFSDPSWKWDLSEKLGKKQDHFSSLVIDLHRILEGTFTLFEELLLLIIQQQLEKQSFFRIARIREENVDKECPVAYVFDINRDKLNNPN